MSYVEKLNVGNMKKNVMDMTYHELDNLLDSLLKREGFPKLIKYSSNRINYHKRDKFLIIIKALNRLIQAEIFYIMYVRKKIRRLKKSKHIYYYFKKTGCLKSLRMYLYLSKIGLTDLLIHVDGAFDDKLFANFAIATMLYDGSFDVQACRKYMKDFDAFIMDNKRIEPKDEYLSLFKESVDYLKETLGKTAFDTFMNYVKIEHVSQCMSIYQLSDEQVSKKDLLKITFTKGGISALAMMYLMAPKMNEKERKAIYELGAVMQLIDDIIDMKEDLKIGILTLPNQRLLTYQELKQLYIGTVDNLIDKCSMNPNHSNGTLDMLCWFADIILEKRYYNYLKNNITSS